MQASVHEFKLNGNPWFTYGEQAVEARVFITKLLQCLLANGLAVVCALDISRNLNDKGSIYVLYSLIRLLSGVFVMRTCAPANVPHFCVAPTGADKIKLLHAPPDIISIFRQTVTEAWTLGIQSESELAVQFLSFLIIDIICCTVNVCRTLSRRRQLQT